VPGEWKRRQRVDPRSKSRTVGRPPIYSGTVEDRRLAANRRYWNCPQRVSESWHREQFTRTKAEVAFEYSLSAYEEWFESLDDDVC
jgi:hypothetical protein